MSKIVKKKIVVKVTAVSKRPAAKPALHYKFHPLVFPASANITLPVAKAAVENLQGCLAYLTPDTWIKGEYHDTTTKEGFDSAGEPVYTEVEQVCLIGAVQKIDGLGELLAGNILHQAVSGQRVLDEEFAINGNFLEVSLNFMIYGGIAGEDYAQIFNDHDLTTLQDVQKLLKYAIRKGNLLVEKVRGQSFRKSRESAALITI